MTGDGGRRSPLARMVREVGWGALVAGGAIYLTFFGTAGSVEVATLIVAVGALIWFASVDPRRLVDDALRPRFGLFALSALGVAIVLTAALVLGTGTMLAVTAITAAAWVVGVVRAVRLRLAARPPLPEEG